MSTYRCDSRSRSRTVGGERDRPIGRLAPLGKHGVERIAGRLDRVAERLEELADQDVAAPRGQDRDADLERQRLVGELLALLAPAVHRRAELVRDGHRQERRRDVRPVVDVRLERRPGPTPADESDRIDVEQERRGAALCRSPRDRRRATGPNASERVWTRPGLLCSR